MQRSSIFLIALGLILSLAAGVGPAAGRSAKLPGAASILPLPLLFFLATWWGKRRRT